MITKHFMDNIPYGKGICENCKKEGDLYNIVEVGLCLKCRNKNI